MPIRAIRPSTGKAFARAHSVRISTESRPSRFFAAAVLLAEFRLQSQPWIDALAVCFVAVRALFVLAYLTNFPTTRTLLWNLGFALNTAIFFMPAWGTAYQHLTPN